MPRSLEAKTRKMLQRMTTGWAPDMGAMGQEKGGKQAEMQLRMGTQIRDRQRQARMDTGTRSTVLDSHPYTRGACSTLCRSRLEAEKSLS